MGFFTVNSRHYALSSNVLQNLIERQPSMLKNPMMIPNSKSQNLLDILKNKENFAGFFS